MAYLKDESQIEVPIFEDLLTVADALVEAKNIPGLKAIGRINHQVYVGGGVIDIEGSIEEINEYTGGAIEIFEKGGSPKEAKASFERKRLDDYYVNTSSSASPKRDVFKYRYEMDTYAKIPIFNDLLKIADVLVRAKDVRALQALKTFIKTILDYTDIVDTKRSLGDVQGITEYIAVALDILEDGGTAIEAKGTNIRKLLTNKASA